MKDKIMSVILTDDEREVLKNLVKALRPFRDLNDTMPLQYVLTFISVAIDQGRTISEISDRCEIDRAVGSRQISDMSDKKRHDKKGYGLVESKVDVMDRRVTRASLTPVGYALIGRVIRTLAGHAMKATLR